MNYPVISDDYPAYDDYNRRYYNNDNYFHYNHNKEKIRQNMSPIILFNDYGMKKSFNRNQMNMNRVKTDFMKSKPIPKTKKSAKVESSVKCMSMKFVVKLGFILICCGICLYQTIDIFNKYASYPMDVNVIVEEMKLLQLPGITICNNNIVTKEYLTENIDQFEDLEEMTNGSLKEIAKLTTEWMRKTKLNELLGMTLDERKFAFNMECDSQFDPKEKNEAKKKDCNTQDVIKSLQRNGVCYTYFHKMANYTPINNDACKMLGTCAPSQPIFDANEIVRFEVNFRPAEYTSKELPVSGRIAIHDNTEIGDSLSNAFNLEPGYYYQFFIKIQSTAMLKKPYATNCLNYLEKNQAEFNQNPDFVNILLSRKQCYSVCIGKHTSRCGGCWPPELPYTKDNQLDINKTYVWCQWKFDMEGAKEFYGSCVDPELRMKCAVKCQPSCWTDHYEVTLQKLSFDYYGREGWSSENEASKKKYAVVSIRYWTTERTIHEYSPMFTILDMVCNVGGLVSMYTGMSLVALFDYFAIVYHVTHNQFL